MDSSLVLKRRMVAVCFLLVEEKGGSESDNNVGEVGSAGDFSIATKHCCFCNAKSHKTDTIHLMKPFPLRGRKLVDRVRRKGAKWKGKHMQASYLKSNQHSAFSNQLFVGTSASTKLHKSAVKRNRMRRRCREAFRISLNAERCKLKAPIQLLISPRSSSLTCDFGELKKDAEALLSHLSHS